MSNVEIRCPSCGEVIWGDRSLLGQPMTCSCGRRFTAFGATSGKGAEITPERNGNQANASSPAFSPEPMSGNLAPEAKKPFLIVGLIAVLFVFVFILLLVVMSQSGKLNSLREDIEKTSGTVQTEVTALVAEVKKSTQEEMDSFALRMTKQEGEIARKLKEQGVNLLDAVRRESKNLLSRVGSLQKDLDVLFGRSQEKARDQETTLADLQVLINDVGEKVRLSNSAIQEILNRQGEITNKEFERNTLIANKHIKDIASITKDIIALAALVNNKTRSISQNKDELSNLRKSLTSSVKSFDSSIDSILKSLSRNAKENAKDIKSLQRQIDLLSARIVTLERR